MWKWQKWCGNSSDGSADLTAVSGLVVVVAELVVTGGSTG